MCSHGEVRVSKAHGDKDSLHLNLHSSNEQDSNLQRWNCLLVHCVTAPSPGQIDACSWRQILSSVIDVTHDENLYV